MTQLLDGKQTAKIVRSELQEKIATYSHSRPPGMAAILVGDDTASQVYVGRKEKALKAAGFYSEIHRLSTQVSEADILSLIDRLNNADKIDGILVQLPLPTHISQATVLRAVNPEKDVDGFHPNNLGRLFSGNPLFIPCTPKGIITLLKRSNIPIEGKKAVVVGRSLIVGKPIAMLLLQENATVTMCHSHTKNLEQECQQADILVVAAGKPAFIKNSFVKDGAVVVDVGIHRQGKKLIGDVDFEAVSKKASYITPVPGGVGPMTIAMLLENTWESFLRRVET